MFIVDDRKKKKKKKKGKRCWFSVERKLNEDFLPRSALFIARGNLTPSEPPPTRRNSALIYFLCPSNE